MNTRVFAGAFLRCGDEVLLMKRSETKKIAPGLWAGVGGHLEPHEIHSPITACLREIEEETGILPAQIERLDLRYFALCKSETLDSVYYFTGVLSEKPTLRETDEGSLHWVDVTAGADYQMTAHTKAMYLHWINDLHGDSLHCFLDTDEADYTMHKL